MATSRLIASMSREGMLLGWFGQISRQGVPKNAIFLIMCVASAAPLFGREALGWVVYTPSAVAAVGYLRTSLAVLKLAVREGKIPIVVTGVLGAMLSLCFCVLWLASLPGFDCSLSAPPYVCLSTWTALGLIFYFGARKTQQDKIKERV